MQLEAVITRDRVIQFLVLATWFASTIFFLTTLIDWAVTLNSENRGFIVALVLFGPIILSGLLNIVLARMGYFLASILISICTLVYMIEMLLAVATQFHH